MKLINLLGLCLAAMAAPGFAAAAPLAAYSRGPAISTLHLSPDGKMLAYQTTNGDERHVIVQTIDDRRAVADVVLGQEQIRDIRWAGNKRLLVLTLQDDKVPGLMPGARTLAQSIDLDSKKAIDLLRDLPKVVNIVSGEPSIQLTDGGGAKAIMVALYRDPLSLSLFEADLTDGSTKLLAAGARDVTQWIADRAGRPLSQVRYNAPAHHWEIMARRGVDWTPIASGDGPSPVFIGLTADGAAPILEFPGAFGSAIRSVAMDGTVKDVVPGDGYTGVMREPSSERVYGGIYRRGDTLEHRFIDPADQARWAAIQKAYAGAQVGWVSASGDRQRMIVLVTPPNEAPYYALVDLALGKSRIIGDAYAGLGVADVSQWAPFNFTTSDGMRLTGYLTLPKGKAAKGLPLIVVPPSAYDTVATDGFTPLLQGLASRGYAVLQVNYRGLPGVSAEAAKAGMGQLGDKSLGDISTAVRQLAAAGAVDPARVCTLGTGYLGGYSALAVVAKDPGVYRCAVAEGGLYDVKDWMNYMDRDTVRDWFDRFGVKRLGDPRLVAKSPLFEAEKIKSPVMIVADGEDNRLLAEQTRSMVKALQKTGGKVEQYNDEGDNEVRALPSQQVKRVQAIVTFLEANNPPN